MLIYPVMGYKLIQSIRMQELRLVLIIVGALAIAGLLLHGLWSSRKEKPAKFGEKPLGKLDKSSRDSEGFDKDGVGSVRVVSSDTTVAESPRQERKEPELHFGAKLDADPLLDGPAIKDSVPTQGQNAPSPVMTAVETPAPEQVVAPEPAPVAVDKPQVVEQPSVAEPKPVAAPEQAPVQQSQEQVAPTVLATEPADKVAEKVEPVLNVATAEQVTLDEPAQAKAQQPETAEPLATASVVAESQTNVKVETALAEEAVIEPVAEPVIEQSLPVEEPEQQVEKEVLPPDYLVLNVHARNGEMFRGSRLFNAFEQNHLIFGENSVYHRHADAAGTGPAIFSVTNMVHPAHFPEGGSESFETPGVAFYLMLPCEMGRADQNFNLMLQTVQRIADSLGGDVLDHERNLITPHRISGYRDKAQRYTVN
ncbi:cell division protein ZipA [Photobacterium sp. BZF1]|uniref:cell division protein ZipA n=1 Tax=Photobacterium sp. BZF1 TaxID=1904457 RepID=UPI002107BB78|nr:cell division protein ZipA [Photobacterium sp. BZF1]